MLPALVCLPLSLLVNESKAQTMVTGPSSSQSPYVQPVTVGGKMTSILTTTDAVSGYKMAGTPDGMGTYDNNDGTFTVLMNHEFGNTAGTTRAHGSTGTFVSKWIINKSDLSVVSGGDLIQKLNLWDVTSSKYITYYASAASSLAALTRFCSGDLPAASAYYNSKTGKGTKARIYMNGEESGNEGRPFGHIATGPNAGNSYELPYLGKASWENYVASARESDTTVVIGMDDATPGQVYVYIGTKKTTGTDIEKAGLSGGNLYGVTVDGLLNEVSASFPAPGTKFTLTSLGDVHSMTGAAIESASNTAGITRFLRPEDGCWDPSNDSNFYFNTTNSFNSPSRLWKLHFSNPDNYALGGTITAVLDGTEGTQMLDNLTIDHYGNILLVEDVGGNAHLGKVWQYNIATDVLKQVGTHDTTRFLNGGSKFLTQDEEASGILDAQEVLGPGMFLVVDQAHYGIPGEAVEGGQFLAYFNQDSYNANPEISISGAGINISNGDMSPVAADNTHFGMVDTGMTNTRTFVVKNAGPAALKVSGINITGTGAASFSLTGTMTFPLSIPANDSLKLTVQFAPTDVRAYDAMINISSNDFDEKAYSYAIQGSGVILPSEINVKGNLVNIADGDFTPGTANNTDYGKVDISTSLDKEFIIHNTGTGVLRVTGISFSGTHATEFTVTGAAAFPWKIAVNDSQKVTIRFAPLAAGLRKANVAIANNDNDEDNYEFALQGTGRDPVSVASVNPLSSLIKLYPNPTGDAATIALTLKKDEHFEVSVFDLQGREVTQPIKTDLKAGDQTIVVNTSNLPNGNYMVQVSSTNQSIKIKMAVAH